MRLFTIFAALLCVLGFASTAQATDEFGARFSADTPAALQDYKTPEQMLSEVEPAAGDEAAQTQDEETDVENQDEAPAEPETQDQ